VPSSDSQWFVAVFVVFWLMICGLLSFLGGWYELARRFKTADGVDGERFYFRSAAIGWRSFPVSYGSCLFATVGPKGIALSILIPFRFLHPPLLIPWSAVERCERVTFWFMNRVAVQVAGFNRRLLFGGALGREILEEWSRVLGRSS
jgi:hypothetical protein